MQLLLGDARAAPRLLILCSAPLCLTQQQERTFLTQQERTFPPSYSHALSCHPSPSDARTLLPCCLHASSFFLSVFVLFNSWRVGWHTGRFGVIGVVWMGFKSGGEVYFALKHGQNDIIAAAAAAV